jgi:hypothetical protein
MIKDGRAFRYEARREIVMFFDVSDTSPYLRAARSGFVKGDGGSQELDSGSGFLSSRRCP